MINLANVLYGINMDNKNDHNFCITVRNIENMCGKDGKNFEKI